MWRVKLAGVQADGDTKTWTLTQVISCCALDGRTSSTETELARRQGQRRNELSDRSKNPRENVQNTGDKSTEALEQMMVDVRSVSLGEKEGEREREGGEAFFIPVGEDDNEQVI
jgi:hypothetical protein